LQHAHRIYLTPVFHDLTVNDAPDANAAKLQRLASGWKPHDLPGVSSIAGNARHDLISFGNQVINGMISRSCGLGDNEGLFEALTVSRCSWEGTMVKDVSRNKLVKNLDIAGIDGLKYRRIRALFSCSTDMEDLPFLTANDERLLSIYDSVRTRRSSCAFLRIYQKCARIEES
jgi:hypothetical protein